MRGRNAGRRLTFVAHRRALHALYLQLDHGTVLGAQASELLLVHPLHHLRHWTRANLVQEPGQIRLLLVVFAHGSPRPLSAHRVVVAGGRDLVRFCCLSRPRRPTERPRRGLTSQPRQDHAIALVSLPEFLLPPVPLLPPPPLAPGLALQCTALLLQLLALCLDLGGEALVRVVVPRAVCGSGQPHAQAKGGAGSRTADHKHAAAAPGHGDGMGAPGR